MTDILISARRGGASSLDLLYGTVTFKPTLAHSRAASIVLPAPVTYDLVDGEVVAKNVQPTPPPVDGEIEWAYVVTFKDRHDKSYEFMVGVPDSTTQVNFTDLPRYFETKPPLFGQGPKGEPGEAATIAIGSVTSGTTPAITNSGTNTDAVLDFVLPQGPKGDKGDGVTLLNDGVLTEASPPSAWPVGVSVMQVGSIQYGWPSNHAVVTTIKRFSSARAVTRISNHLGITWERTATFSGDTWNPFKQVASTDLATTLANGLMSKEDKTKLDTYGTLAYQSKNFTDSPSTYPEGTTVGLFSVNNNGFPNFGGNGFCVVETIRPRSYSGVVQRIYPYVTTPELQAALKDKSAIRYGQADTWGELVYGNQGNYVTPEMFGAVGNGVADDSNALENSLEFAMNQGLSLVLKASSTYGVSRTITNLAKPSVPSQAGRLCVSIRSDTPGKKATIKVLDSAPTSNARVVLDFSGTELASTPLTGSTQMQTRRWYVGAGTYLAKGMLMGIESSLPWYYDPRTSTSDARKGELHRVDFQESNSRYINTEDPAWDGYVLTNETVRAYPYIPICADIRDISIERDLPPEGTGSDGLRRVGLQLSYAVDAEIVNVDTIGATAKGIGIVLSHNCKIVGGRSMYSNNYFEGYGVQVNGSTFTVVDGRYVGSTRRGVDISQGGKLPSHHTTVKNCRIVGGGKNSRGEYYNYSPVDGSLGDSQSGMGSHGPSDYAIYENNTILDCHAGITCRGGNEIIRNNQFYGRFRLNAIAIADGGGIYIVEGNNVVSGWTGTRKTTTILDGGANINSRRAAMFLQIYSNADWANLELIVQNNYCEVQEIFIQFGTTGVTSAVPSRATITNNTCLFAASLSTVDRVVLYNPIPGELVGSLYRWRVGPNTLTNQSGTGAIKRTQGINLAGAQVLEYTTSGATT